MNGQSSRVRPYLEMLLRERGMRVTSQRLVIHEALQDLGRHASADEVLGLVSERLPGISLPTVYSTLELLADLGIVRRVHAGSGALLWDPRPDAHHHLVCRRCGRVDDVSAEVDTTRAEAAAAASGFEPEEVELVVSGLCADCARL